MNPNARKRLNAMTRYDRDAHLRAERKSTKEDRRSDKTRLFSPKNTIKESDNMQRINHAEFTTYASGTTRVRVPNLRFLDPRICMPDGHTIAITRKRAARYLRDMRSGNNGPATTENSVGALQRKARKPSTLTRQLVGVERVRADAESQSDNSMPVVPKDPETRPTTSLGSPMATRLWESYMLTARKLTWEQYMARWVSDNTG